MTEPLPTLLDGYYHDTLLEIAAANGLPTLDPAGHRVRKDVLVRALCARVYTQEGAKASSANLSVLQRTVLDRILLHGGEVETNSLHDELEREGIVQASQTGGTEHRPRRQAGDSRAGAFEDVLAELTLRGLIVSDGHPQTWNASAKLDLSPGLRLIVPEPVRKGLPQPALPSVEWGSTTLPAAPAETSVALAQRDLFIFWSHVRAQPLAVTQLGLVQKRTLRALNEQLLFPDPALAAATNEQEAPRLHFLRLLLQGLQLLRRENKWITAQSDRQVPLFWDKTVEQRTSACLRVWMHLSDWSELSSLGMSSFDLDLQHARSLLLEQLRLLEPGVWLSADRFLSRLSMTVSNLLFSTRDAHPVSLYYYPAYPGQQSTSQRLAEMEGTFVGGALSGPLHWMGIVDIAADGSRLLAFRLNHSGALALGCAGSKSSAGESPNEARLIVQPNFQVFALGPVAEATLARLELFADRVKADRSAFEYTLSHAAIYRGQKLGLSTDQVIGFLEQASGTPLPQNVLRTLQEWGEQHERIVFHRSVALCEAQSAEMMADLWNEPATQPYLQQRLTPTVALLKKGRVQALRETLLQRDFLPALSTRADRCAGRLQATAEGELAPVHEGPDLLLDSCLRDIAEPVPTSHIPARARDGVPRTRGAVPPITRDAVAIAETQGGVPERDSHFHITEGAVRRAAATGPGVKGYLDQLSSLHHGEVPAALQMRIKAWGRYYGKASLQEAVLLEVKDSATADELMADAELAPLLSRFAADPRGRLLLVHAQDLERLQRLLEERGVEVVQQP